MGHVDLQLRAQRGPQFPVVERAVLAARVSYRRPARGSGASMLYLDYAREQGEWIPNRFGGRENLEAIDFLKRFNELVHQEPGAISIAEESTAWPGVSRPVYTGGLGFTMKWNMGWMHDMFQYFAKDSVFRKYHQQLITFSMLYAFTENFVLPVSHD